MEQQKKRHPNLGDFLARLAKKLAEVDGGNADDQPAAGEATKRLLARDYLMLQKTAPNGHSLEAAMRQANVIDCLYTQTQQTTTDALTATSVVLRLAKKLAEVAPQQLQYLVDGARQHVKRSDERTSKELRKVGLEETRANAVRASRIGQMRSTARQIEDRGEVLNGLVASLSASLPGAFTSADLAG